jgi:truncated hemoglobin YjbI
MNQIMRKDIENEEDVKLLVDAFYTKVVENSNI